MGGGDVLYLALEDSPRRLQSRLTMLLAGEAAPPRLQLETEWPRLDEGGMEKLDGWLEENPEAQLVLIDVWPRIRSRRAQRTDYYTADYDAASPLQALAISRGVAVVALHHTRKAEAEDFVETVQGTFGTAGAADTIIVLKRSRGQADATLYVTGRDVQEQELALRFEATVGTWALLGDAAEFGLGETRRELLEAVRAHGSLTPKQAAEVTGVAYPTAKVTLWRMNQDGQLEAANGRYSLRNTVPPVTDVTEDPSSGNRVAGVTGVQGALDA